MKHAFNPSDENRLPAPLSPPSAAMGEGLGAYKGRFFAPAGILFGVPHGRLTPTPLPRDPYVLIDT
jgi:hypothetical protein